MQSSQRLTIRAGPWQSPGRDLRRLDVTDVNIHLQSSGRWCSWLSLLSNTQAVLSSNLGRLSFWQREVCFLFLTSSSLAYPGGWDALIHMSIPPSPRHTAHHATSANLPRSALPLLPCPCAAASSHQFTCTHPHARSPIQNTVLCRAYNKTVV